MSPETELELDLESPAPATVEVSEHSLGWGVAWRLVRGGLRADLVPLLLVALLVAAAALTAAAGPARLRDLADRALRQNVSGQALDDRSLVLTVPVVGGSGEKEAFTDLGVALRRALSPDLQRVFPVQSHDHRAFDVPGSDGIAMPGDVPAALTLIENSRTSALIHYVQGKAPDTVTPQPHEIPVAVSTRGAQDLQLVVGSRFVLGNPPPQVPGDTTDRNDYAVVVGIFERTVTGVTDPDDAEYWKQNDLLLKPVLGLTAAPDPAPYWSGELVVAEAGMSELAANHPDLRLGAKFRETVDPAQLTAASVSEVRRRLAGFNQGTIQDLCTPAQFLNRQSCGGLTALTGTPKIASGMPAVLDRFQSDEVAAQAVESFGVAGLLAVELAAVFAAARLVAARRAGMVALYRARGASRRQAGLLLGIEALLVIGPATALGYRLGGASGQVWPPLLVALFGVGVVPAVVMRRAAPGAVTARGGGAPPSKAKRRTVEALVGVLAVAGVLSLRARGTSGTAVAGSLDPLIGAVPVLVGAATALVLVKILPRPVLAVAALIGRTRSTAGWLGVVRAAERGQTLAVASAVLTLTLSGAVFGGVVVRTLSTGEQAAADRVGADAVITAPMISRETIAGIRALKSVTAVQPITVYDRTITSPDDGAQYQLRFLGVDSGTVPGVPGYDTVAATWPTQAQTQAAPTPAPGGADPRPPAGSPVSTDRRPGFTDGTTPRGTPDDPIPVLGSPAALAAFPDGLLTVQFDGARPFTFQIVSTLPSGPVPARLRAAVPGDRSAFVLLPTRTLALASGATDAAVVVISGSVSSAQLRDALVDSTAPNARIQVRAEDLARMRSEGLSKSLSGVFIVCSGLSAVFAVLIVVLELAGSARERGRTVSFLRTMGLPSRSAGVLTVVQLVPTAVAAALAGVLLGTLLPRLLGPALDLTAFTDGYDAPVRTDWRVTSLLGLALLATVAVAAGAEAVLGRRRRISGVLRLGAE